MLGVSVPACTNGYGLLCGLWVWRRRTNRRPCCPPMSNPSNSPWTAWPYGCGWWDKRMAAQHLPRELCGLAVDWKSWLIQWRTIVRSRSVHTVTSSIIWVETAAPLSQSIDLPMDCMAWRFWTMRPPNGCSTPAPRSSAAKQWFEQLAQKKKLQAVAADVQLRALSVLTLASIQTKSRANVCSTIVLYYLHLPVLWLEIQTFLPELTPWQRPS